MVSIKNRFSVKIINLKCNSISMRNMTKGTNSMIMAIKIMEMNKESWLLIHMDNRNFMKMKTKREESILETLKEWRNKKEFMLGAGMDRQIMVFIMGVQILINSTVITLNSRKIKINTSSGKNKIRATWMLKKVISRRRQLHLFLSLVRVQLLNLILIRT